MMIGVLYDSSGRIVSTYTLETLDGIAEGSISQKGYKYGVIRSAPAELQGADLLKMLKRLRIKDEHSDGTVTVEVAKS
jgi:hypothetical protein